MTGSPADRRAWVIETLTGLAPDFAGEVGDGTALAEGGLGLDSLALVELVSAIEKHLGLAIPEHEITDEYFGSVGRLLRLIDARLG